MAISPTSYKNILIVKLSAIGDVIHALPVAHALKERYPTARITWVVEKPAYDLLTNNPDINEIIIFDKPKFKSLAGLLKYSPEFSSLLKARHFDLALDLQGLFKSAAITALSGAKQRLGYCNMRELSQWVSRPVCGTHSQGHIVERYLDVARYLDCNVDKVVFPIHITAEEAMAATQIATHAGLDVSRKYIVLAPGTNWISKCWPTNHYAQLAGRLFDSGIIPVIIGGPDDHRLATEINLAARILPVDLTGRTNLKQLSYIIKQAAAFVGGDTGPMHLAVALGTPVITMFGPTDPNRNGPYQGKRQTLVVPDSCQGCWKRVCPKQQNCMEHITVENVFNKIAILCNL